MRRVIYLLLCVIAVLTPIKVEAASIDFNGYYCDPKQSLGDGTFYMICHIVVTTDMEINTVKGTLILENVTLESIKTYDDWTSENGLSTEVSFVSETSHSGTFTIADLIYTGNSSDENCEASFMPDVADYVEPDVFVCMIVDDVYYGADGAVVTKEDYLEQCCNYTCTIIDDEYYFDSSGNLVTYEEFVKDCSDIDIVVDPDDNISNPQTGIDYGYVMLPLGIVALVVIVKLAKKNTKIYKI